jgi:glycosyltransferase involved in cell wall biosynthesis
MTKKRIAYIGIKGLPSRAGADRVVEAIVSRVDPAKYEPYVYCSASVVPAGAQLPGIHLLRIRALTGKHLHATSLFLFAALHALFVGRYDLVHLHNVEASFVLPILRLRYKVISTSHGPAQKREKWSGPARKLIRWMEVPYIRMSNTVTSVSQPLAREYEHHYQRAVHFIPNGVTEAEEIDLAAARTLLDDIGVKPHNYVLFAAGRIMASKGCHLLLEATRNIDADVQYVIVGDASHAPAYEEELHALADERVRFVSFISEKATLMGLLKLCRVLVFPSTVEAMSMMLLEAASLETPVVCSDIPENVSVLPEQAVYFRSGDATDLAVRLRWALDHPAEMEKLAREASEWVKRHNSWDAIVHEYEQLYSDI